MSYLEGVVERVHPHALALVALEPPEGALPRWDAAFAPARRGRAAPAASLHPLRAALAAAAVALVAHLRYLYFYYY